ncbi:hypothetical protein BGW36DRAFT_168923 [Talaromyces proteolyticus]|uniref:Uncharacterized protein n=1 Tax=Talaromyces proteolyticus TaxID=1131652 RepID=A0AAD4KPK9_9EURO|nr:uncharacterized protein BGW36DRAFT_168923 [Talaromyces proteolyticus]KAH8697508.1 hypothetical protein BGW36DRAFT_168923 [Talaromyces proteolyticus]
MGRTRGGRGWQWGITVTDTGCHAKGLRAKHHTLGLLNFTLPTALLIETLPFPALTRLCTFLTILYLLIFTSTAEHFLARSCLHAPNLFVALI